MTTSEIHHQKGVALIEAMVAFLVVAVGVLGTLKINASLLASTGQSKARAEAVALAQDRMERARDFNLQVNCNDTTLINSTDESFTGINEAFVIKTTFADIKIDNNSDGDTDDTGEFVGKDVSVCVRWRSGTCTASSAGDRVILNSRMACSGSGTSAQIGQGGTQNKNGGFLKTPAGRATTGTNIDYNSQSGDTQVGTTDSTFKIKTIRRSNGDLILVSTDTNKILLITKKLACETQAPEYSTIRGKILLESKSNDPIIPADKLFPLISEGAVCRLDTTSIPTNKYPSTGTTQYFWGDYKCYVGAEWWGNIGVVSTESGNADSIAKRACTGNDYSTTLSNNIYSKHPQLSGSRGYRGYRNKPGDSTIIETVGIGETSVVNAACTASEGRTVYNNTSQHFVNHHFAVWTINGTINDSQCNTVSTAARVNDNINSESPTVVNGEVVAHRNPGKYYCMSNTDGVSCQYASTPASSSPVTVISGTIDLGSNNKADFSGIEQSGADCITSNMNTNNGKYSCTLNWSGNVNTYPNGWNGSISFIPGTGGAVLCPSSTSTKVITPNGYTANVTINASTTALDLSNVDKAVTGIKFDFAARKTAANCP